MPNWNRFYTVFEIILFPSHGGRLAIIIIIIIMNVSDDDLYRGFQKTVIPNKPMSSTNISARRARLIFKKKLDSSLSGRLACIIFSVV